MRDPDERVKRGMCVPMLGRSNSNIVNLCISENKHGVPHDGANSAGGRGC
jgi:hypothetical protein